MFAVLGNSPVPILLTCSLFFLLMFFFLYSDVYRKTSLEFRRVAFFIGFSLILFKGVLLVLDVGASEIRNKIITPSPFAIKTLISDGFSKKENSLGKTSEPTFLNHVKGESSMPAKMVLMLVESWGESHGSLVAVEKKLKSRGVKVLKTGFTDYHGSTMQGEIRELCSEYIQFDASTNFSAMADGCAPAYMKNKGYEVFGVHGYQKMFYARDTVWKSLGIDHAYFQPEMSKLKTCPGPFLGICDEDMINFGVDLIRQQDRAFLYMLSLSSHEPIASSMPEASVQYFQGIETIGDSQLVARSAIGILIDTLSTSTELGCTEAYVVGDHQPPSAVNSGQLSENQVPYIRMSFHCEP
ncbi:sulfatase-like hydrolase/transferase [Janthinobacterium sp. TB1-E2]|uniref:Sulfatase-like hydrolase/transferase n=1 Tax=Janthinobacterium aestuarii TaxID=2985511 RepID=A0ABZ2GTI0_9BURK|nr:sulfatase-like hydrolase/transferase [Janthinobacterium lividum]